MFYDNTDFNYEISMFQIPGNVFMSDVRKDEFVSPEEGFLRGNMERGTYVPYKNYTYFKLNPENEREGLLFQLMAYSFAINDLNLYLDLHPENKDAYRLFRNYVSVQNELEKKYVDKFGPMTVTETQGENFDWIKNPWPWENEGGSKYV